jgi:hypothetical protein
MHYAHYASQRSLKHPQSSPKTFSADVKKGSGEPQNLHPQLTILYHPGLHGLRCDVSLQIHIHFGQSNLPTPQQMANPLAYNAYPPHHPGAYNAPYNPQYPPQYQQGYAVPQQGVYQHPVHHSPPSNAWGQQQQRSGPPQGGFAPHRGGYQGVPRSSPPINGKAGGPPVKSVAVRPTVRKPLELRDPDTNEIIVLRETLSHSSSPNGSAHVYGKAWKSLWSSWIFFLVRC